MKSGVYSILRKEQTAPEGKNMFGKDHHTDDSFNIRTMLTFCMLAFICGCNTPSAPESIMTPAVKMPEWLYRVESEHLNKSMTDEEKMRFVISLALENVDRGTGGPFGAAIFEIATGKLVAAGVNSVVPANQSWAHAEMTAFARAQMLRQSFALKGCMLVTSCEPCAMCFGATPWSGVEQMLYGAPGDFAREIGFDEGDKVSDWHSALEKRGIKVTGPMLPDEAKVPFTLYHQKTGKIY